MGFSAQLRRGRRTPQPARRVALAAALLIGLAAGPGAGETVPGPPLDAGADRPRAWCPAPAPAPGQGPWNAATFGAAVLGIAWVARRRGEAH